MRRKFQTCIRITIVLVCYWVARTRAEDVAEVSVGTRSLDPSPFQLVLPRDHLMGDWYGTRTWLEDRGIVPTVAFVTDALGSPSGGKKQGFTTANDLGLELNFDLEKLGVVQGASFLLSMSYRFGGSLSANYIHNVFAVQQVLAAKRFSWATWPTPKRCLMIASRSDSVESLPATTFSSHPTTLFLCKPASMAIR